MKNIDFKYIKEFISSILKLLDNKLDKETISAVQHYLSHDEYEMAFEGLFIEIMNLTVIPKIDFSKSRMIGRFLKLDKESVFDFNFWEKFNEYTTNNIVKNSKRR